MAKKVRRPIVVDGETYFWYRAHSHRKPYEHSPCVETLTIFPHRAKRAYVRLRFKADDRRTGTNPEVGYPESGVLRWLPPDVPALVEFNLNRPKVVAAFIRLLHTHGWEPDTTTVPLTIENGLPFVEEHTETLQAIIAETKP